MLLAFHCLVFEPVLCCFTFPLLMQNSVCILTVCIGLYTPSGYSYQKKSDSWINLYAHLSLDGTVFGAWGCKKNIHSKALVFQLLQSHNEFSKRSRRRVLLLAVARAAMLSTEVFYTLDNKQHLNNYSLAILHIHENRVMPLSHHLLNHWTNDVEIKDIFKS